MRFHLPVLLSFAIALPAFAEPPRVSDVTRNEAVTDAPLASERAASSESMPPTRIAGITLTSIGAALAAVGTGFAIAAGTADGSADPTPPGTEDCDEVRGDSCIIYGGQTAYDYSIVGAVGIGVGVAAVTAGVILISVRAPEPEPSAATVQLDLGLSQVGLSGRF